MKILHIIPSLGLGGTEKILYEICSSRELKNKEITHVVLALKGGGLTEEKLKKWGLPGTIQVIVLNSKEGFFRGFFSIPLLYYRVRDIIRKIQPEIVHTWLSRANIIGRWAAKGLPVKVISSLRVMEKEKRYHIWLEKWTSHLADKITVNSKSLEGFAIQKIGIPQEKIYLIPNGIQIQNPLEKSREELRLKYSISSSTIPVIGTVSRLHYQKGIDVFLRAARIVLEKYPNAIFLIAGDGQEKESLIKLARRLSLEIDKNIRFCGWVPDSLTFISILKVFVLTSRWEGDPNVILEAMSLRVPVIATAIGGTKDIINHGQNGLLINPEDPNQCAKAIEQLIGNQGLIDEITLSAINKIQKERSLNSMIYEYSKLYESVAK